MPVQYDGRQRRAPRRRARRAASSTSRTWARSRRRGPQAERAAAAPAVQRRRPSSQVGGAQYSVLCREDGGVLDDLFTYRLARRPLPDGHQRRQPRRRTSRGSAAQAEAFDVDGRATRRPTTRCSPSRARRRARSSRRIADAPLPDALHVPPPPLARPATSSSAARATPARTASSCCCDPADAGRDLGRGRPPRRRPGRPGRARHAAPGGLLPPLRQRPDGGARADRGRPGLGLQGGHRLHRRPRPSRAVRAAGPAEKLVAVHDRRPGIARQGNPVVGGGEVTSGHDVALAWSIGIGMAYVPRRPRRGGHRARDRRARASVRARRRRSKAALQRSRMPRHG